MCQDSCLRLLKKNKGWMTTKEIAKELGISAVTANLAKLYKYGEVKRKLIEVNESKNKGYAWKIK